MTLEPIVRPVREPDLFQEFQDQTYKNALEQVYIFTDNCEVMRDLMDTVSRLIEEIEARRRVPRRGAHFTRQNLRRTGQLYRSIRERGNQLQEECTRAAHMFVSEPSREKAEQLVDLVQMHTTWVNLAQDVTTRFEQQTFLRV